MKRIFTILFSAALLCGGCDSVSEHALPTLPDGQVALYDIEKEAIAYIDYADEETIYLFSGEPVAFVAFGELVFHFDGRLLGWFRDGVVYDTSCHAVGAVHGIVRGGINTAVTAPEKAKGAKQPKPLRPLVEDAFARPVLFDTWSEQTLTRFFGVQD